MLLTKSPLGPYPFILLNLFFSMLAELVDLGKEFIIVTHAIGFARGVSDYIDQGKILEHDRDIIQNPQNDELKYFLSKVTKF